MNARTIAVPLALLLLVGCRSATIESTGRSGYDYSTLRSYFWISAERAGIREMPPADRQFSKGLMKVVGEEFQGMGYVVNDRDPDFVLFVGATTRTARRRGGWTRHQPRRSSVRASDMRYEEGAIVIVAIDPRTGEDIWSVWARDVINEGSPPTEAGIVGVVRDMVSRFPARAAQ